MVTNFKIFLNENFSNNSRKHVLESFGALKNVLESSRIFQNKVFYNNKESLKILNIFPECSRTFLESSGFQTDLNVNTIISLNIAKFLEFPEFSKLFQNIVAECCSRMLFQNVLESSIQCPQIFQRFLQYVRSFSKKFQWYLDVPKLFRIFEFYNMKVLGTNQKVRKFSRYFRNTPEFSFLECLKILERMIFQKLLKCLKVFKLEYNQCFLIYFRKVQNF